MVAVAAKWTLEEYHQMTDSGLLDDKGVELIKGPSRTTDKVGNITPLACPEDSISTSAISTSAIISQLEADTPQIPTPSY